MVCEEDDPVGDFAGEADLVRGEDDALAGFGEFANDIEHLTGHDGIEG